jgi:ElaB/YqjD/DUF883 family membrane-anchored ribosome-binding protein
MHEKFLYEKGVGVMGGKTEWAPQEEADDSSKSEKPKSKKEQQEKGDTSKIDEALEFLNKEVKGKKNEIDRLISEKYSDIKTIMIKGVEGHELLEKIKKSWGDTMTSGEQKLKKATTTVDKEIHEDPWLYLSIAVGIGFFLGYIVKKSQEQG